MLERLKGALEKLMYVNDAVSDNALRGASALDTEFSGQRIRPVQTSENLEPLSVSVPVRL